MKETKLVENYNNIITINKFMRVLLNRMKIGPDSHFD